MVKCIKLQQWAAASSGSRNSYEVSNVGLPGWIRSRGSMNIKVLGLPFLLSGLSHCYYISHPANLSTIPLGTMASTEMVQCHPSIALPLTNTPPESPSLRPFVTLSDEQSKEMANAIAAMKMVTTIPSSGFHSRQLSPENPPPSLVTAAATAAPGSPVPCHTCSTKKSLQVEMMQLAQDFLGVLKSLSTKQEPPPPPIAADKVGSEEPLARASKFKFKAVNEVFVFRGIQIQ